MHRKNMFDETSLAIEKIPHFKGNTFHEINMLKLTVAVIAWFINTYL